MKTVLLLVGMLLLHGCLGVIPITTIPKFEVTVVDAETGEPLEGAVMLAEWSVYLKTPLGDQDGGLIWMAEFVSDDNGKVGMETNRHIKNNKKGLANVGGYPLFAFYKEGYERSAYSNYPKGNKADVKMEYRNLFNGGIIRLKRYDDNSIAQFWDFYDLVENANNYSRRREVCVWENFPYAKIAPVKEENKDNFIEAVAVRYGGSPYCDDFELFAAEYLNR